MTAGTNRGQATVQNRGGATVQMGRIAGGRHAKLVLSRWSWMRPHTATIVFVTAAVGDGTSSDVPPGQSTRSTSVLVAPDESKAGVSADAGRWYPRARAPWST